MASVNYGKGIMASVIMAKLLWQMKLSLLNHGKCNFPVLNHGKSNLPV